MVMDIWHGFGISKLKWWKKQKNYAYLFHVDNIVPNKKQIFIFISVLPQYASVYVRKIDII